MESLVDLMLVNGAPLDEKDLPHIYMFEPYANKAIPYPEKLEDLEHFNAKIILAWADVVKIESDLERLNSDLKELNEHNELDKLSKEDLSEIKEYLNSMTE